MRYLLLDTITEAVPLVQQALAAPGPVLLEVDMNKIGPFAKTFAGPPVRKRSDSSNTKN